MYVLLSLPDVIIIMYTLYDSEKLQGGLEDGIHISFFKDPQPANRSSIFNSPREKKIIVKLSDINVIIRIKKRSRTQKHT